MLELFLQTRSPESERRNNHDPLAALRNGTTAESPTGRRRSGSDIRQIRISPGSARLSALDSRGAGPCLPLPQVHRKLEVPQPIRHHLAVRVFGTLNSLSPCHDIDTPNLSELSEWVQTLHRRNDPVPATGGRHRNTLNAERKTGSRRAPIHLVRFPEIDVGMRMRNELVAPLDRLGSNQSALASSSSRGPKNSKCTWVPGIPQARSCW